MEPLLTYTERRILDAFPARLTEALTIVQRVGAEASHIDDLRATLAAREADCAALRGEVAALRHEVAVRNNPPPSPYRTWDEHNEDQADMLRGELAARRLIARLP